MMHHLCQLAMPLIAYLTVVRLYTLKCTSQTLDLSSHIARESIDHPGNAMPASSCAVWHAKDSSLILFQCHSNASTAVALKAALQLA